MEAEKQPWFVLCNCCLPCPGARGIMDPWEPLLAAEAVPQGTPVAERWCQNISEGFLFMRCQPQSPKQRNSTHSVPEALPWANLELLLGDNMMKNIYNKVLLSK